MKTVKELAHETAHENLNNHNIRDMIMGTSSYDKFYTKLMSECKELQGSEKQIKWAKDIREEKISHAAYKITFANYCKFAQEVSDYLAYKIKVKESIQAAISEVRIFKGSSAKAIIKNR